MTSKTIEDAETAIRIHDGVLKLKAERDTLRDLVQALGARAVKVCDGLEDEGDRCFLGSTNDADMLRAMKQLYDEYRFETGDMGDEDALSKTVS